MKTTITTTDSSTITDSKKALPVLPAGTEVKVTREGVSLTFKSGWSTPYQLCAAKGTGGPLHQLLSGACKASPVEIEVEISEE
jgi:hypothetical protein